MTVIGGDGAAKGVGAAPQARQSLGSGSDSGAQQLQFLFDEGLAPQPEDLGYRGPTACAAVGISYRQLDYWARTGLVEPSIRPASGSGTQRLYGFRDILVLKVVKRLLDAGISLQQIRQAIAYLRDRGTTDLAQVTLMSDGVTVYEFTSQDDVIDLLQGGQGVFGIALSHVWREVEGSLANLPAERPDSGGGQADTAADDISAGGSPSGRQAAEGESAGSSASGRQAAEGESAGSGASGPQADELARRRARRSG